MSRGAERIGLCSIRIGACSDRFGYEIVHDGLIGVRRNRERPAAQLCLFSHRSSLQDSPPGRGSRYRQRCSVSGKVSSHRLHFHTKLVPDRSHLTSVDRDYVRRIVERSRQRLRTERLDLVQFAWWDYDVPGYVETALWLEELREQGLIARIGVTNFDVPRLREILEAGVTVETNQIQYSVLDHRPENGMAGLCRDYGIALLCYGTLAGGFLSDRYLGAPVPGAELANRSLTKYRLIIEEFGGWHAFQEVLELLRDVGHGLDASVAQVALAYVLGRPGVESAIVGMSSPQRIEEAVFAMDLTLPSIQVDRIRRLVEAAPGPPGDCFGLERDKGGRHAGIMKYDLNVEAGT